MNAHLILPAGLVACVESMFGRIEAVESLQGVAGNGAARIRCTARSVVVKRSANPREQMFYERYSGQLQNAGVSIPELYASTSDSGDLHWVVMEDVPHALQPAQWTHHPEQLQILLNLHLSTWGSRLPLEQGFYRPTWTRDMTEWVCTWYEDTSFIHEVADLLYGAQQLCQPLFKPHCFLSGDANPTNWRVRSNGSLVLTDWERFCCGHPAIDLAITMPNFGSADFVLETSLAERYLMLWSEVSQDVPFSVVDLTFKIRLAKLWSGVEFMANAAKNPEAYPQATVKFIRGELPGRLRSLSM